MRVSLHSRAAAGLAVAASVLAAASAAAPGDFILLGRDAVRAAGPWRDPPGCGGWRSGAAFCARVRSDAVQDPHRIGARLVAARHRASRLVAPCVPIAAGRIGARTWKLVVNEPVARLSLSWP
jgi:hypothetical protein